MEPDTCPQCGSKNIDLEDTFGFLSCNKCGYNEGFSFDDAESGGERNRQVGKTRQSPYKKGGGQRSAKRK